MAYDPNSPYNPGGNPPQPNSSYSSPNYGSVPPPPASVDPYQSQQPYNPYGPAYPEAQPSQPGYNNPYEPTVQSQSHTNYPPNAQPTPSYPGYPPNPTPYPQPGMMPPPQKPGMTGGKIALIVLAIFVVLAGIGAAIGIPAYNTAQNNAHSTATAQANATANAQATATYIATHFPFSTKQVLNDSLASNNSEHNWMNDSLCKFTGSSYLVQETKENTFVTCAAKNTDYTDFSFEVTMQNLLGNAGGVMFRANDSQESYYLYLAFYDGSFGFYYYSPSAHFTKIMTGEIPGFSTSKVALGVTAKGSDFKFFANGAQVGQATDSTFSHGQIGVVIDNDNLISQANFSNAKVWEL